MHKPKNINLDGCFVAESCPTLGDLPDPGLKPESTALAGGFFTTESPEKA